MQPLHPNSQQKRYTISYDKYSYLRSFHYGRIPVLRSVTLSTCARERAAGSIDRRCRLPLKAKRRNFYAARTGQCEESALSAPVAAVSATRSNGPWIYGPVARPHRGLRRVVRSSAGRGFVAHALAHACVGRGFLPSGSRLQLSAFHGDGLSRLSHARGLRKIQNLHAAHYAAAGVDRRAAARLLPAIPLGVHALHSAGARGITPARITAC